MDSWVAASPSLAGDSSMAAVVASTSEAAAEGAEEGAVTAACSGVADRGRGTFEVAC